MGRKRVPDDTMDPTKHVAAAILGGIDVSNPLRGRHSFLSDDPPYDVQRLLERTGFHRVTAVKSVEINNAMISALVERWRPETHSFHLPYGECTITLEDVALLLGVPIEGSAVIGNVPNSVGEVCSMCESLIGRVPGDRDMRNFAISLEWLKNHFGSTLRTDRANVDRSVVEEWHARGYILRLFGSVLFPDKSNDKIHAKYLVLLSDISDIRSYSWGAAILAHLYRGLCRATRIDVKQVDGCLMLLQAWAWFRLPNLAPVPQFRWEFPIATRWMGARFRSNTDLPITRKGYRAALDRLRPDDFVWQPYMTEEIQEIIPEDVREQMSSSPVNAPIISFEAVEWHGANRVMRQFGMTQDIPVDPPELGDSHNRDLRKRPKAPTWAEEHREWIMRWAARALDLSDAYPIQYYTPSQEYWDWYLIHSLGILLSGEPVMQDPRYCQLPIHMTPVPVIVPRHRHPPRAAWPEWGAVSQVVMPTYQDWHRGPSPPSSPPHHFWEFNLNQEPPTSSHPVMPPPAWNPYPPNVTFSGGPSLTSSYLPGHQYQ